MKMVHIQLRLADRYQKDNNFGVAYKMENTIKANRQILDRQSMDK